MCCNKCGAHLNEGARFCNKCGAMLNGSACGMPNNVLPSKKSLKPILLISVSIVIVIAVTVALNITKAKETDNRNSYSYDYTPRTVSKDEAVKIAKSEIENWYNLMAGGPIINYLMAEGGKWKNVSSVELFNYGSLDCSSSGDNWIIETQGTLWGNDSYGLTVAKFKFSAKAKINKNSGKCSVTGKLVN